MNSDATDGERRVCAACGAPNNATSVVCWSCGGELPPKSVPVPGSAEPPEPGLMEPDADDAERLAEGRRLRRRRRRVFCAVALAVFIIPVLAALVKPVSEYVRACRPPVTEAPGKPMRSLATNIVEVVPSRRAPVQSASQFDNPTPPDEAEAIAERIARLDLVPPDPDAPQDDDTSSADLLAADGLGDVFIQNIPMVVQEEGGCAVAAAERLLRAYGIEIDQYDIAAYVGTTSQGTQLSEWKQFIADFVARYGFALVPLLDVTEYPFGDLVEGYNEMARSMGYRELPLSNYQRVLREWDETTTRADGSRLVTHHVQIQNDFAAFRNDRATDVVVAQALADDARLRAFVQAIVERINHRDPLFWGVTLGVVPERGAMPQTTSGHMRLIIGYNLDTAQVLYSDSWGRGHELKRMSFAEAYAITDYLSCVVQ